VEQTVDIVSLFTKDNTYFEYQGKDYKCCVSSRRDKEPKLQDMTQEPLPKERFVCSDRTGCGCMFGDTWHSVKHEQGYTCPVKLSYLSQMTGAATEELDALIGA
jgi:hypothetical protein